MQQESKINEFLGYKIESINNENIDKIKNERKCPFTNGLCTKKSGNEIIGTCTIFIQNKLCIVCPKRFIYQDILNEIVYKTNILNKDKIIVIKEQKVGNNFFDFIAFGKELLVTKYIAIEVQSLDTCGSSSAVINRLIQSKKGISNNYVLKSKPLLINWKMTAKTFLSQILEKLSIVQNDMQHLAIVIQKPFFDYLFNKNESYIKKFNEDDSLLIFVFDINYEGKFFLKERHSMSNKLFKECFFSFKTELSILSKNLVPNDELDCLLNKYN